VEFLKDRPVLTLKRISKPGGRKYVQSDEIRSLLHGNSLAIISTSQGLLTNTEAKKQNVGGEILCTIS
jgi:small subunit ribosomal protein S8